MFSVPILMGKPGIKPILILRSNHPRLRPSLAGDALPLEEGDAGLPLGALARGAALVGVELVDLLQAESLGLIDEEVDEGDAEEAGAKPDEEDLALQVGVALAVVDEVGGGVGDCPVEEPLAGSS